MSIFPHSGANLLRIFFGAAASVSYYQTGPRLFFTVGPPAWGRGVGWTPSRRVPPAILGLARGKNWVIFLAEKSFVDPYFFGSPGALPPPWVGPSRTPPPLGLEKNPDGRIHILPRLLWVRCPRLVMAYLMRVNLSVAIASMGHDGEHVCPPPPFPSIARYKWYPSVNR